jgi:parallel beta-helix repeat protein
MRYNLNLFSIIAANMAFWAIAPALFASPVQQSVMIYVSSGSNLNGDGSPNNPYSSITAALATKPVAGTVIQLNQGVYSAETGESFPIKLPAGVTLRGEPMVRGINTFIKGSGKFVSPSFTSQNITILADDDVRVEGLTLTNPTDHGTAIWLEKGKRVAITNNTFVNSDREGVFLAGTADAIVSENIFKKNGANGLSAVGNSTGEIRNNVFEDTGFGLAIGQKSRVTVNSNNILNNTDGIVISNSAAPILRNNIISNNQRNGVVIVKDGNDHPTPDLGTSGDLGKNIFRNNLGKDLNNNSGVTQTAIGNDLDLKKIGGKIALMGDGEAAVKPIKPIETSSPIALRSPILNSDAIPNPVISTPTPTKSNTINSINSVEINRSPQPNFNIPSNSSSTLSSTQINTIQTLPDVPKVVTPIKPIEATTTIAMQSAAPITPKQFETLPDVPKVVTPIKPIEATTTIAMQSAAPITPKQFETLPDVPKVVTPSKPIESATSIAMRSPAPDQGLITNIASTQPKNAPNTIESIEIIRAPETTFNKPVNPPIALSPSSKNVMLESLPDVPSAVSKTKPTSSNVVNPHKKIIAQNPSQEDISKDNINDILIDRDPIPITPPQVNPPKSQFIPSNLPKQASPNPSTTQPIAPFKPNTPNPVQSNSIPRNLSYNARIAALVPPPAIDKAPYLVIIPSSDSNVLNQVRSIISTAKFIPSRFGYMIMVQGYPDRDRAEVLKTIVRSEMGLDARLVHQNNL